MAAGGIALATHQSARAATGPALDVHGPVIVSGGLYPTSAVDPDPALVAVGTLPITGQSITARCTNCTPGSPEAQQFQDLRIKVDAPGAVYQGPLAALDAAVPAGTTATVKVWLADTDVPQAQGVTTTWSFVTARPTA
ncbi:MAG TPA: hypothetical protein VFA94_09450 [Acidimicrobiales bacterium]|nr:hypothetical protein [Acidimicrobiales bacterium]